MQARQSARAEKVLSPLDRVYNIYYSSNHSPNETLTLSIIFYQSPDTVVIHRDTYIYISASIKNWKAKARPIKYYILRIRGNLFTCRNKTIFTIKYVNHLCNKKDKTQSTSIIYIIIPALENFCTRSSRYTKPGSILVPGNIVVSIIDRSLTSQSL